MQRFIKLGFIFCLTTIANSLVAQPCISETLINREVKKRKLGNADTIIRYSTNGYSQGRIDSLNGIGICFVHDEQYLIYRNESKLFCKKIVCCSAEKKFSEKELVSNEIALNNDSLFVWLDQFLPRIKHESIYSYIYQFKMNDSIHYESRESFHSFNYLIDFHIGSAFFSKSICSECIYTDLEDQFPNLNYAYNVSTKLYALLIKLQELFETSRRQFQFSKPKL